MALTDNTYIDNSCQKGDQVKYRVRTVAKDGRCSPWSTPGLIVVGDNTPPSDPTNFQVTSGYAGCLLTWGFPLDEDYAYTEIYRQTAKNGESIFYDGKIISGVTGSNFRLIGTKKAEESFEIGDFGAIYYFKIRHVDNAGNKSNFSTVQRGEVRKLKSKDVCQKEASTNIYLKPSAGIPTEDIRIRIPDAQGNIVYKNGDNHFFENQNKFYDLQKAALDAKADLVKLNYGVENNAASILTTAAELRKDLKRNSSSLEDLNNKLNDTATDLINRLTASSSALRTDIENNVLNLNQTKNTMELIKTDLNTRTTELQALGQIVENQKQMSTGMMSEIEKNTLKAESLQLALNSNMLSNKAQDDLINDLRAQQTNIKQEAEVLGTTIKAQNTETQEINRRLGAIDQALAQGNTERNAIEQLINESYNQIREDFTNGQALQTVQNEETWLLIRDLKTRLDNNDLGTAQAQREIEALQNRLNNESNLTNAISNKLTNLDTIQKNILTTIDQLRNYDSSIDSRIANIVTANQTYRTANDALVQTKINADTAKNIMKELLKDQEFSDAVKGVLDQEFKPLLDAQGQSLQSTQDQVNWLQSNVGTPALVAFSKTINSNSNFQQLYNQVQNNAAQNVQFKTDINNLINQVSGLQTSIESLINGNSNLQQQINSLGLGNASNLQKINALIDTDSGFRTQINNLIAQNADFNNQFLNYKNAQAAVDAAQNALMNSNAGRLNVLETVTNNLTNKVNDAVSDLVVKTTGGTQTGTYRKFPNIKGMNTLEIDIDVHSTGLVKALSSAFVIRPEAGNIINNTVVGIIKKLNL